jgi:DNA-binding response OmpR family regulator
VASVTYGATGATTDPIGAARFLVVDDDDANVQLITRVLRIAGATDVHGTGDAEQVVQACVDLRPDVLLLDLHLGHVSGHDLLDELREVADPHLAVLVLSGETREDVRARALAAGARDFITKPFDITDLVRRIGAALDARGAEVGARR